jgi:hypothetical protein
MKTGQNIDRKQSNRAENRAVYVGYCQSTESFEQCVYSKNVDEASSVFFRLLNLSGLNRASFIP